jgi:hypothetical protein
MMLLVSGSNNLILELGISRCVSQQDLGYVDLRPQILD